MNDGLFLFLERLRSSKIPFQLSSQSYNRGVMVSFATPGVRWEVEFTTDGVEVERFFSNGKIEGVEALLDIPSDEPNRNN